MGIAKSLQAVAHQADMLGLEKPTITMPMWALNVMAHEIQVDLSAPGSLFPRPHLGFKFWGISFEPSDMPLEEAA